MKHRSFLSEVILICYLTFQISLSYSQSQVKLELVDSITSSFKALDIDRVQYSISYDSSNNYFFYTDHEDGNIEIEKLGFNERSKRIEMSNYKIFNPEEDPFCYFLAFQKEYLYLLGQDVFLKYKLRENRYRLIDSINYTRRFNEYPDYNKIIPIDSNRVLLVMEYPFNRKDLDFEIAIFDFSKRIFIKKRTIDVGKGVFLKFESAVDCISFYNNKILVAIPGENIIHEYDTSLKMINTYEIPFYLETNIVDTLEKYFSDSFIQKYRYSPKAFIEIMSRSKGFSIFGMQQMHSVHFINDSLACAIVNNEKMDFNYENMISVINLNTNIISSSIEHVPISYWSGNLPVIYKSSILASGKHSFVIIIRESFNDSTNTLTNKYVIYKRKNLESFVDNHVTLDNNIYFIYDFKKRPITVNTNQYDSYMFFDAFNCISCVLDKRSRILFITQMSDVINDYKIVLRYKKEYPNCSVFFFEKKFYNMDTKSNVLHQLN